MKLFGLTLLMMVASVCTAAAQGQPPCMVAPQFDSSSREIIIDWNAAAECLAKKGRFNGRIPARIDEDVPVAVRSTHFNFVNYALKYDIEETVVESYVLLAKLWEQVLGLGELGILGADIRSRAVPSAFQTGLLRWINAIVTTERAVDGPRTQFSGNVHLTGAQLKTIEQHLRAVMQARDALIAAFNELPQFDDFQDYERYSKVRPVHDAILVRTSAYLDLAALTLHGQLKNVGKRKGGTFITVTLTPAAGEGADASPTLVAEYVSHSRLPLAFHAGYAASKLDDLEFERVRALGGTDLFTMVKTNTSTQALAAFISYELFPSAGRSFAALGTIGTDFAKPGERIYLGGSVRLFRRVMLTMGRISGDVQSGTSPVAEQADEVLGGRELFGAISTKRDWDWFFALSFGVF